jgi:hypothetical protein
MHRLIHGGEAGIRRQVMRESEGRAEGNPVINHSFFSLRQPFNCASLLRALA